MSICAQTFRQFSCIGSFIESFSRAQGAAAPVFQLITEVKSSELISYVDYNILCLKCIVQAQETNINEPDVWKDIASNTTLIDINGDIEFNSVNFVYPTRKDVSVLHNLNFVARAGQTTALVGSSGSGKSIL